MSKVDWINDSNEEIKKKIKNSSFDHNMLMNAAYSGRVEIINFMNEENHINKETINQADALSGYCPLHNAVLGGSVEAVETLINLGADVNKTGEHKLVTALHLAASLGHTEIIKNLVAHDAKVNAVVDIEITPLHLAAYEGQLEAVNALIELGADVNAKDKNGETALHLAKRGGFPEIVEVLISTNKKKRKTKKASNKKDSSTNKKLGEIPLHFFAFGKRARDF